MLFIYKWMLIAKWLTPRLTPWKECTNLLSHKLEWGVCVSAWCTFACSSVALWIWQDILQEAHILHTRHVNWPSPEEVEQHLLAFCWISCYNLHFHKQQICPWYRYHLLRFYLFILLWNIFIYNCMFRLWKYSDNIVLFSIWPKWIPVLFAIF